MTIKAPAKINFGLSIGPKRDDGYHPISTIFLPVTLYDVIELNRLDESTVRFESNDSGIPHDESNLCRRAAKHFFEVSGIDSGVHIRLEKNIPVEAGLGGGSSDAAAVLQGLSDMYPERIDREKLNDLAVRLGADVPFFLIRKPCSAEGIGEILNPVDFSAIFQGFILLVIPSFSICSADAYGEFDRQQRNNTEIKHYGNIVANFRSIKEARSSVVNDFEKVLSPHYPDIEAIKQQLYDSGALYASLTGSGSAMYGMFEKESEARSSEKLFKDSYQTEIVRIIY